MDIYLASSMIIGIVFIVARAIYPTMNFVILNGLQNFTLTLIKPFECHVGHNINTHEVCMVFLNIFFIVAMVNQHL